MVRFSVPTRLYCADTRQTPHSPASSKHTTAASTSLTRQRGKLPFPVLGRCDIDRNSYAGGQSEIAMGEAIKKLAWMRNDVVISTKLNWLVAQ